MLVVCKLQADFLCKHFLFLASLLRSPAFVYLISLLHLVYRYPLLCQPTRRPWEQLETENESARRSMEGSSDWRKEGYKGPLTARQRVWKWSDKNLNFFKLHVLALYVLPGPNPFSNIHTHFNLQYPYPPRIRSHPLRMQRPLPHSLRRLALHLHKRSNRHRSHHRRPQRAHGLATDYHCRTDCRW